MKKVFISGATRGIGKATALCFADAGYEVGFCYRNSENEAKDLAERINAVSKAYPYCCDLSDFSSLEILSKKINAEMGTLDALVNNAALSEYGVFQSTTEEAFDRVFAVNVKSVYFLTARLSEKMIAAKKGSIINLSSVWGQTGASCEVLYSASKAAIIGFSKALAKELAPSGIRVNCISPGVVDTDMMLRFNQAEQAEISGTIPMERFAAPSEIARLAFFLAEEESSYITGQVIGINGGMYC